MKSVLILATALGLSMSAAGACSMHEDVQAKVDTTTVASIAGEAGEEGRAVATPTTAKDAEKAPMSVRSDTKDAD